MSFSCGFPSSLDIAYSGDITYCRWDDCHVSVNIFGRFFPAFWPLSLCFQDNFADPLDLFNHVMMHIDFLSSDDRVCDEELKTAPQHRCLWEQCYRQFESKGDLRCANSISGFFYLTYCSRMIHWAVFHRLFFFFDFFHRVVLFLFAYLFWVQLAECLM